MDTNSFEIRSGGTLRAVSPGKLAGYAIIHNALSQDLGGFVERVLPGACKRSLASPNNIRALVEHDAHKVLARVGAGTLKLEEQEKGIYFEIDLPDVSYARDLGVLVERGDICGVSFGFRVNPDGDLWEMRSGQLTRDLSDITLSEISIVSDPAYQQTEVAKRSMAAWQEAANFDEFLRNPIHNCWLETCR